jgi:SGNH-like hydrolase/esterase family protein
VCTNEFFKGLKRHAAQTFCYFCCMLRVSSALLITAGLVAAQDATLHWMPVISPKIDVVGLPWFQENHGEFWRLPARSRDAFPVEVWNLALDPTGGRIRFRTDSSTVALRLEWPHPPGMRNMHSFGQSGCGPLRPQHVLGHRGPR